MSRLQINVTSRSCRVTKFESHKVFSREDDDFVWPIQSGTRRLPSRWGYGINRVFLVEMSYRLHTSISSRSLINGSDLMGFALRAVIKMNLRPKLIPIQGAAWQQQNHRQEERQSRNARHGVLLPRRHSQGSIGILYMNASECCIAVFIAARAIRAFEVPIRWLLPALWVAAYR